MYTISRYHLYHLYIYNIYIIYNIPIDVSISVLCRSEVFRLRPEPGTAAFGTVVTSAAIVAMVTCGVEFHVLTKKKGCYYLVI